MRPSVGLSRSEQFSLGSLSNARTFEIEDWDFIQHKDYQVHVLQKMIKLPLTRPVIPTTKWQRLAYLRAFTASPFKTMLMFTQQLDFASFIWTYGVDVILRSLPMNYVHAFLAAYSPDDHLYISKMFPLCHGASWQVIATGILYLASNADFLAMSLHFAIFGIVQSSPWNRCKKDRVILSSKEFICLPTTKFFNMTRHTYKGWNYTMYFNTDELGYRYDGYPLDPDLRRRFMPSGNAYFLQHYLKITDVMNSGEWRYLPYFVIIWLGSACSYKQIYRKYLWKIHSRSQTIINVVYLMASLYIIYIFLDKKVEFSELDKVGNKNNEAIIKRYIKLGQLRDYDMVAEIVIAPPIIQMLLSRSGQPVEPARDSTLITFSNLAHYLFRSLVYLLLKHYCTYVTHVSVVLTLWNEYPIFFQWTFFTMSIRIIGELLLKCFYVLNLLVEASTFVITYQLLVETLVCEWKWTRRWTASILISSIGLGLNICLSCREKMYLYLTNTLVSALTESVVIMWLYPLGRLLDDVYFHLGTPVGSIRKWTLRFVPFFYLYKLYNFYAASKQYFMTVKKVNATRSFFSDRTESKNWSYYVTVSLLCAGIVYSVFKHLIYNKQNWRVLFRPKSDWGPRDHVNRQLRKQFDSRDYIGSQAIRYLSRHMLAKSQTPTYRLDIRYETASERRRSTIILDNFEFFKKDDVKEVEPTPQPTVTESPQKLFADEESDDDVF